MNCEETEVVIAEKSSCVIVEMHIRKLDANASISILSKGKTCVLMENNNCNDFKSGATSAELIHEKGSCNVYSIILPLLNISQCNNGAYYKSDPSRIMIVMPDSKSADELKKIGHFKELLFNDQRYYMDKYFLKLVCVELCNLEPFMKLLSTCRDLVIVLMEPTRSRFGTTVEIFAGIRKLLKHNTVVFQTDFVRFEKHFKKRNV